MSTALPIDAGPNLLRVSTAARRLGLSRNTIYGMAAKRLLASVTLDGVLFVDEADVARLEAERSARVAKPA